MRCVPLKAPFRVCLTLQHSESNGETKWLDQLPVAAPRTQRKRGRKCKQKEEPAGNDTSLASALKRVREVDPETFTKIVPFPFPVLSTEMGYTVGFLHESVFVGGRYVKLARDVSQTPWYADATAAVRGATETIIAQKIAPHFQADGIALLFAYSFISDSLSLSLFVRYFLFTIYLLLFFT